MHFVYIDNMLFCVSNISLVTPPSIEYSNFLRTFWHWHMYSNYNLWRISKFNMCLGQFSDMFNCRNRTWTRLIPNIVSFHFAWSVKCNKPKTQSNMTWTYFKLEPKRRVMWATHYVTWYPFFNGTRMISKCVFFYQQLCMYSVVPYVWVTAHAHSNVAYYTLRKVLYSFSPNYIAKLHFYF